MKKIQIIYNMLALLILLGLSFQLSYAAGGTNIVLANQNPDPVAPGNIVTLSFLVSNIGNNALSDVNLEFVENENFNIVQGEDKIKSIGTLPVNSLTSSGYIVVKYQVNVDEKTPLGENPLTIKLSSSIGTSIHKVDVTVRDENPTIEIRNVEISDAQAGAETILNLEIGNKNSVSLRNVVVTLDLDSIEGNAITPKSGSNQKIITLLKNGEVEDLSFNLIVSPSADSVPYLLPIDFEYEDVLGNTFTSTLYSTIKVYSEPRISVKLDSQEMYTKGKGKISLAIANPGASTVKGTQLEILSSEDYEVVEGDFHYIGDLNPDDFQTIQSQVYVNSEESASLKIQLTYLDTYNVEKTKILDIPLKIYAKEELESYGLSTNGGSSGSGSLITILIVGVIAFFVGRRFGKKKLKKI